jgi:ribose/xylose/arabinose/galactoside ABC-type transport system permease subunit
MVEMPEKNIKSKLLNLKWVKSLTTATPRDRRIRIFIIALLTVVACFFIYLAIKTPGFLTSGNAINMGQRLPMDIIVAVAQTMVIISGGIDLSVGAIVAFSGALTAVAYCYWGIPVWVAILMGIVSGAIFGYINGLIIAKGKVPDFITTLGTMVTIRGIALILTGGLPVPSHVSATTLKASLSPVILWIGGGTLFGKIPAPLVIAVAIVIIGWVILNHTSLGRGILAVGGNKAAAKISGINVESTKIKTYVISGILSALAGVILIGRMNSANALMADPANLDSIAAVVIGGTGLEGGQGSVFGSLIGSTILGMLKNMLNLLNVQDYIQKVFTGILIIAVVAIDQLRRRKQD